MLNDNFGYNIDFINLIISYLLLFSEKLNYVPKNL